MRSVVRNLNRNLVTAVAARNATRAETDDDGARDDQAVDEVPAEFLLLEDAPEGVERGRERPGSRLGRLDLAGRFEGAEHHPVEGEGDDEGDQERGRLGGEPPRPPHPHPYRIHSSSPLRRRIRR